MKKYNEQYDAYYDDETMEWLESKCSDPECSYCSNRPEKALDPIQECINVIRKLWYEENNKDSSLMDNRQVAMHVGMKSAYIKAINKLGELK